MDGHHHINPLHHYHQPQQQQHVIYGGVDSPSDRHGLPQWSVQETRDFLIIRAELDQKFMETKRNKILWEVVSKKLKELGYNRSAEQCKCKWKNLVTRYKGCETTEPEIMRQQFPYYNEMQSIFTARMQRMLWAEAEGGGASSSKNKKPSQLISSEGEDENDDSEGELEKPGSSEKKDKKKKKKAKTTTGGGSGNNNGNIGKVVKLMEEFMRQQERMDREWWEAVETREKERRAREMEWRRTMEAIEKERIETEMRWREREEMRRVREEARAEKRDALVTALLNKLRSRGDI